MDRKDVIFFPAKKREAGNSNYSDISVLKNVLLNSEHFRFFSFHPLIFISSSNFSLDFFVTNGLSLFKTGTRNKETLKERKRISSY